MLNNLQPLMQRLFSISHFNSNLFPADDWPGIYLRRYEMDTASCDFYTSIKGLLNCVQSAEDGYLYSITGCICFPSTIIG